jgi:spectinomycin phosphotransferase
MREKPDLKDEQIAGLVWDAYGLEINRVEFLPRGADYNAAVYRVVTREPAAYFLKLRKGSFEEISVLVPRFIFDQGIRQILPPLKTKDGRVWASLEPYTCVLYPFIEGSNGFEKSLSDDQWADFGTALHGIHSLVLPPELQERIPHETYSSRWREIVKRIQERVEHSVFEDPLAAQMAAFMRIHRNEIRLLAERAGQLGSRLKSLPMERILCHSDVHAGNLLLSTDDALYIVDWENPILAPKERDLMFIGAGVGGTWNSVREETLFYQGYGEAEANPVALAYYRHERIVQDIAAYGEQILLSLEGGSDREQGFQEFTSLFSPGGVVEIAYQTDQKFEKR